MGFRSWLQSGIRGRLGNISGTISGYSLREPVEECSRRGGMGAVPDRRTRTRTTSLTRAFRNLRPRIRYTPLLLKFVSECTAMRERVDRRGRRHRRDERTAKAV